MISPKNVICFTCLLIFSACSNSSKKSSQNKDKGAQAPVSIDVSVARLQDYSHSIEASGSVLAGEFVELKPEISGRIVLLNIQEGREVSEGTLLVKLFDEDLQAQLKKYESQLAIAKTTEKRLKALLDVNGLNQQEYDQALIQVNNIQADIDFVKAQRRKTEIRAPFSGSIGLRTVSKGAYVSPQDVLATLQQTAVLKIDFVLPESHSPDIKVGEEISVVTDRQVSLKATIIAIEPQVNTATRNIKVRALLNGRPQGINPGAFARVMIAKDQGKKAILVPSNCIIPETRDKKMILLRNGKAKFVAVETGFRDKDMVEITSGLVVGDTFAINGIMFLKPDAMVKIKSVK
jgi:membrane fusion protein (multidrug efflux system)